MTLNITKKAYTKLIQKDINFLRKNLPSNTQQSVEFEHIMLVLCNSIDMFYSGKIKARSAKPSEINKLKELFNNLNDGACKIETIRFSCFPMD